MNINEIEQAAQAVYFDMIADYKRVLWASLVLAVALWWAV